MELGIIIATLGLVWAVGWAIFTYLKPRKEKRENVDQIPGPHGEVVLKATLTGFEKELTEGAAKLKQEAEDYFNAAERDFEKRRYADAADNYQKSSGVIPTMSAYLNLGLSCWYVSDFARAQEAFSSGLRTALKKQDRKLEAAFRGNIGNVYFNQGKLEEALKSHQDARAIFEEIGNPLGQAGALNNIGLVYRNQGKLEEALKSHQDARAIHKEIGNPLGQANALGNIGLVYFNQGKLEEALKSHQDALAIHKEIGNPLGQANAIMNIGLVYFNQGKLEEALKSHQDARAIFEKIGNPPGQANAIVNIGLVYFNQGKLEEALKLYKDARAIFLKVGSAKELQHVEQLIEQLKSP